MIYLNLKRKNKGAAKKALYFIHEVYFIARLFHLPQANFIEKSIDYVDAFFCKNDMILLSALF